MANQIGNFDDKLTLVITHGGYFLADTDGNRYPNRLTSEQASSPVVREAAYHYLYPAKGAPVIDPETERLRAEVSAMKAQLAEARCDSVGWQAEYKRLVSTNRDLYEKLTAAKKIIAQQADTIRAVRAAVLPRTEEC